MNEEAPEDGRLTPFIFPHLAIRGALMQAGRGWRNWYQHRNYPITVRDLLGQAMAAAPLMASTLKFEGRLSLQAEGDGPISLMVVQISHQLEMRGMARWKAEVGGAPNPALLGKGRLGLIIEPMGEGARYEGLVPLEGETLAGCLETYFRQSEQLETRLCLAADGEHMAGMLLQRMPAETSEDEDAWGRLSAFAETLSDEELLELEPQDILHRLFHEETLQLFDPRPVPVTCNCSHGRTSGLLLGLGEQEVRSILEEQGEVEMECGFCGQRYVYGQIDVDQLFAAEQAEPPTDARH